MPKRGFTLAEALLATMVVGIICASTAYPFSAGVQQASESARLRRAAVYGQAMLEEVLARPFFGPDGRTTPLGSLAIGPDSGETSRDLYDDIDDFNGYSEQSTGLRNYINQAISDSDAPGWWRDVQVSYVTFTGQQTGDSNSLATIRVRVFDSATTSVPLVTLFRLVARED